MSPLPDTNPDVTALIARAKVTLGAQAKLREAMAQVAQKAAIIRPEPAPAPEQK